MYLPPDVLRCADADINDCDDRNQCVRWTLRDSAGPRVIWVAFASARDALGCDYLLTPDIIKRRMN